jgi:O-antigen ligase
MVIPIKSLIQKLIISGLIGVPLIILPNLVYYPFITSKFIVLIFIASFLLITFTFKWKQIYVGNFKTPVVLLTSFIFWMFISLARSDVYLSDGLLGLNNRNEGLLSYLALTIFMLATIMVSDNNFNYLVVRIILLVGLISVVYAIIQAFGFDFFNYLNRYNEVITFFGNPNFQSSFMGISAVVALTYSLNSKLKIYYRVSLNFYVVLSLSIIYVTDSVQGFLVFLSGAFIGLAVWIYRSQSLNRYFLLFCSLGVLGMTAVILDILQITFWKSVLFQSSVSYRGDFWRTAWKMTIDNPIFGVGVTGFRDNQRFYRDEVALTRGEYNQVLESSHNRLLDLSSSGGIPLLLLYVLINVFVILSALKVLRREKDFNPPFAAIVACWVAYVVQSFISIFSFSLDLIGWICAGLIVGYEVSTRSIPTLPKQHKKTSIGAIGLFLTISQVLFINAYLGSELKFKSAIEQGEINNITEKLKSWPKRNDRYYIVTQLFEKGGFPDRALEIAKEATTYWPNNYEVWQLIYSASAATDEDKQIAVKRMLELDPLNDDLSNFRNSAP